jgi:small subunit ribosomal protein S15
MVTEKNTKKTIIEQFKISPEDTGSMQVQVALLTDKITLLTKHLEENPKDFSTKKGLIKAVAQRRNFLRYLEKQDVGIYKNVIERLGLRK